MSASRPRRGNLTARERAARSRALHAVADMRRERLSPSTAAKQNGTTLRTIKRHVPSTLHREPGRRRWTVKRGDTYAAEMEVLTAQGVRIIAVQGSRNRSIVGRHWAVVQRFLALGESAEPELLEFRGVVVSGYELLADPDEITEMGSLSELDEIDVYALAGTG